MHIRSFGEMGNAVGLRMVLRVVVFAFLMANLWYRFWTIFDYSRFVGALFVFLGICSLVVRQLDKNNHPKRSVLLPPRPSILP